MFPPLSADPITFRIFKPHDTRRNLRTGASSENIIWRVDWIKHPGQPAMVTRPRLRNSDDMLICEHLGAQKMLVTDREGRTRFKPLPVPGGIPLSGQSMEPVDTDPRPLSHTKSHCFSRRVYQSAKKWALNPI